jgi:RND family efflux transporter MFP subunit
MSELWNARLRFWRASSRIALIATLSAVCLAMQSCNRAANVYAPPPPPEVTVAHPIRKVVTRYLESTGTTEAFQTVELRARVPGFLEQWNFKPGSKVEKGDILFVIDKRPFQAAVERAAAQVMADEAAFKAAASDAKIAEELYAQRAGSEIDKITKIGRRDTAEASLAAAKATLENAKLDLDYCEVRAPISGRITKNFVDVGNLVGAAGQPTVLATLVSSRPIYVSVDSSESDVLMVRRSRMARAPDAEPGQIAPGEWRQVDLAIGDDEQFTVHGRIDYVDPALNPQTSTIRVRARFENEDESLLPGLFARVRIFLDSIESTVVPDIALLSDQAGRFAFVLDDKDVVQVRRVKIGALDGALRVVLDGLATSDRMIVNGLQRARPGIAVKPTLQSLDEKAPAPASQPPASQPPAPTPQPKSPSPTPPKGDTKQSKLERSPLAALEVNRV